MSSSLETTPAAMPGNDRALPVTFDRLDRFTRSYVEAALWTSTDGADPSGGLPLERNYGPSQIDGRSLASMAADCADFQAECREDLDACGLTLERQGFDFWLNRNGHGSGFWDEGNGPVFRRLSEASKVWGTSDLYLGEDGVIHVYP